MKKARQDHFKKRTHQVFVRQLQKYAMVLEAVGLNEKFRKETDAAFAKFWEREGESLRKSEIIEVDAAGNTLSRTLLGDLIEKPDSDPQVLNQYLFSPEARQVQQRYGLLNPYHYNQSVLFASPGQIFVSSLIDANEYVSEINGKPVKIFRAPCLRAIRDETLQSLDIKINLFWPKEEIMNIFELVLDKAKDERESAGKKAFVRSMSFDPFPLRAWYMNKKQGKTPWEITQELYPLTKGKSYQDWEENYSPEARSHLRKVERAIKKADELISSVTPVN